MTDDRENYVRELNARERRRYRQHKTLPLDAIKSSASMEKVVEQLNPKKFYRYGCELDDVFITINDNNNQNDKVNEKRNSIFHLRGFLFFL